MALGFGIQMREVMNWLVYIVRRRLVYSIQCNFETIDLFLFADCDPLINYRLIS